MKKESVSNSPPSEEDSPSRSSQASPMPQAGDLPQCKGCQNPFSMTRLRHTCRMCRMPVCGNCSQQRIRLVIGGDKERVCDPCSTAWRTEHTDQMGEAVDVRIQINQTLKSLLKEKHREIESLKQYLVELIESHPYLQESPSLRGPRRFSSEMGLERINFMDLVQYVDDRVRLLRNRRDDIEKALSKESEVQEKRRIDFGFLQERTLKAEEDAQRVRELSHQRDRLRETYGEQSASIRSLQDRVDMFELGLDLRDSEAQDPRSDEESDFLPDRLADMIFPCLR